MTSTSVSASASTASASSRTHIPTITTLLDTLSSPPPDDQLSASSSRTTIVAPASPLATTPTPTCPSTPITPPPRSYWDIVLGATPSPIHRTPSSAAVLSRPFPTIPKSKPIPLRPKVLALSGKIEKPFACPTCAARFRKRCNLSTHISNVHDKIRPFYCSTCLRRFARKSNCAKHMRLVHRLPEDRVNVLKLHHLL